MRIDLALAGAAALLVLAGCDPTKKNDYRCFAEYGGQSACIQFHITEAEGNVAEAYCNSNFGANSWAYHACESSMDGSTRLTGYCQVDAVSGYLPSNTPAKVFFYDPPVTSGTAPGVCQGAGGSWQGPVPQ